MAGVQTGFQWNGKTYGSRNELDAAMRAQQPPAQPAPGVGAMNGINNAAGNPNLPSAPAGAGGMVPQGTSYSTGIGGTGTSSSSDGQPSISQQGYENQQELQLRAMLSNNAFRERLSMLDTGGSAPRVEGPAGPGFNEEAARNAAFARAKERAGQTAASGVASLKGILEGRGLAGSSIEAAEMGDLVASGTNAITDFTREELINDLNRAAEISDMTYQGNIAQRGQDLNRQQALMGLMSAGGLY